MLSESNQETAMNIKHSALPLEDYMVLLAPLRRNAKLDCQSHDDAMHLAREVMMLIDLVEDALPIEPVSVSVLHAARSLVVLDRNVAALERVGHLLSAHSARG